MPNNDENGNPFGYEDARRILDRTDRNLDRDSQREHRRRQLIPVVREQPTTTTTLIEKADR